MGNDEKELEFELETEEDLIDNSAQLLVDVAHGLCKHNEQITARALAVAFGVSCALSNVKPNELSDVVESYYELVMDQLKDNKEEPKAN